MIGKLKYYHYKMSFACPDYLSAGLIIELATTTATNNNNTFKFVFDDYRNYITSKGMNRKTETFFRFLETSENDVLAYTISCSPPVAGLRFKNVISAAMSVDDHGGPWPKHTKRIMMTIDGLVIFLEVLPESHRNGSV